MIRDDGIPQKARSGGELADLLELWSERVGGDAPTFAHSGLLVLQFWNLTLRLAVGSVRWYTTGCDLALRFGVGRRISVCRVRGLRVIKFKLGSNVSQAFEPSSVPSSIAYKVVGPGSVFAQLTIP